MAKQNKAGVNTDIWVDLYHIIWVISLIAMFAFLDWWIALIIIGIIGIYFFVK